MSTTKSFKEVLQTRSANMKTQNDRRMQFSGKKTRVPADASLSQRRSALMEEEARRNADGSGEVVLDMSKAGGSAAPPTQQQQQLVLRNQNSDYAQSRALAVQSVESTIVELGTIFQELATMVQSQDYDIARIDENITDASANVEGAHDQMLRYMESIRSNRGLVLKIFAALIVFVVLFVMVS